MGFAALGIRNQEEDGRGSTNVLPRMGCGEEHKNGVWGGTFAVGTTANVLPGEGLGGAFAEPAPPHPPPGGSPWEPPPGAAWGGRTIEQP